MRAMRSLNDKPLCKQTNTVETFFGRTVYRVTVYRVVLWEIPEIGYTIRHQIVSRVL